MRPASVILICLWKGRRPLQKLLRRFRSLRFCRPSQSAFACGPLRSHGTVNRSRYSAPLKPQANTIAMSLIAVNGKLAVRTARFNFGCSVQHSRRDILRHLWNLVRIHLNQVLSKCILFISPDIKSSIASFRSSLSTSCALRPFLRSSSPSAVTFYSYCISFLRLSFHILFPTASDHILTDI